jgi:hypothetical protein
MDQKKIISIVVLILFTQIQFIPLPLNCDELNLSIFSSNFYFLIRFLLIFFIAFLVQEWSNLKNAAFVLAILLIPEFFYKERRLICSEIFSFVNENKQDNFYNPFLGLESCGERYCWSMSVVYQGEFTAEFDKIIYEPNHNHNSEFPYKALNKNWYIFYDVI